jgi:hypothetical protein
MAAVARAAPTAAAEMVVPPPSTKIEKPPQSSNEAKANCMGKTSWTCEEPAEGAL